MSDTPGYPGVRVEEDPSGERTIRGAPTSVTAFIGFAQRGPVNDPRRVRGYGEYERLFGGPLTKTTMDSAVGQFFLNGGEDAVVVRVPGDPAGSPGVCDAAISDRSLEAKQEGLWALDKVETVNVLCIPPFTPSVDVGGATLSVALTYCKRRHAMLIVDPPLSWRTAEDAVLGIGRFGLRDENAAMYFPRVRMQDPLQRRGVGEFAPSGAIAGLIARTDAQKGVWSSPAGKAAVLEGVTALSRQLTDTENDHLNRLGVNCLREFPVHGVVVWGARTLKGADHQASEWKYIPVRRTALHIEESLYQGLKWAVFEPNDDPLWSQIRHTVGTFMHSLFLQGAFQGSSPERAYFVKCDRETTTQDDINLGIVNILIGFAPVRPAEFVVIRVSHMAGQSRT